IAASISNTFYVDGTNLRVGIGTSLPAVSLQVVGAASLSTNFEASGYASASQYFGGGLASCNGTSNALTWATTGLFGCNTITSGGGAQLGIEIINSGGTYGTHYGSISFDASHFTVTFGSGTTASESQVRLDWGSGGPASLSEPETVTGFWEFRSGASFSNDVEFWRSGGPVNGGRMFAIFSSTSMGRFGLGDSTPEAFFEIASGSGITASISNIFFVNANSVGASISGKFKITASSSRTFIVSDNGGTKDDILIVDTTSSGSNPGLDITAVTQTRAGATSALTISVPASNSGSGVPIPHSVLWVTDSLSNTLASMNNAGRLGLRSSINTHGAVSNCTGVGAPSAGCIDLAENFPTADNTLVAGEVVSITSKSLEYVARATPDSIAIGVVSTNPAALITGTSFLTGIEAANRIPGYVPIALAGRVPVKVSTENGPIAVGDYLTNSATKPGIAMKATQTGQTIGQALASYSGKEIGEVIIFIQTGFYGGQGLELTSGVSRSDPSFERKFLTQLAVQGGLKKLLTGDKSTQDLNVDTLAAGLEIISPEVYTQNLFVDSINTLSGKDLVLNLSSGGSFIINDSQNNPVVSFDNNGNAIFAGEITAGKINADTISGLDLITDQMSLLSGQVANLSTSNSSIQLDQATILGTLRSAGGLVVEGESQFIGLASFNELKAFKIIADNIDSPILTIINGQIAVLSSKDAGFEDKFAMINEQLSTLADSTSSLLASEFDPQNNLALGAGLSVEGSVIFNGRLTVDSIGSAGELVLFNSDVEFFGRPIFNADTGGFAVIHEGQQRVDIAFEKEYLELPVINVTMKLGSSSFTAEELLEQNIKYVVEQKDGGGFSILLNQPALQDISFGWTAIAVKNPKTFFSIKTVELTPTPSTSSEPTPTASATPIITEVEPPTESLTPELTPLLSSEPTPEPTPEVEPLPSLEVQPPPESTPEPSIEPTLEPTPLP
ncbi:MAG: hypothetical protein Q8R55_01160, partial [Candidatus Taylorbacteria bacterium]|nr:hypothetical protein [Candidatus Taylorbacteria bacterium]